MGVMTDDPTGYYRRWLPPRSEIFHRLEEEARDERIPIVGPVVGELLYLLARLRNAQHILELGTATAYSTLFLAKACRQTGGRITTFEMDEAMARRAVGNITAEGLSQVIEVRCENALEAIQTLAGPMDMIFIDIEKRDYVRALPLCARLLNPGGLLIADNTGFNDAHTFNQAVFEGPDWESVNIWAFLPGHSPEQDGLCLALKI